VLTTIGVFSMVEVTIIYGLINSVILALTALAGEPQFKNSIMVRASDATVPAVENPLRAISVFQEICEEIRRVIYYRPKKPRPSQPRDTKRRKNKWLEAGVKKVTRA